MAALCVALAGCGKPAAKCTPAPAVTFGADDPNYLPAAVRACAFGVSCAAVSSWIDFDRTVEHQAPRSCLADWNPNGLDDAACAPNARNCDEWMACASHGHCPDWCAARGYSADVGLLWTCDGDQVVVCEDITGGYGTPFTDCAEQGMRCATKGLAASCTDGTTCTQASNPHCDGNRVVACDVSTLYGQSQDCAASGGTCTTISFGLLGDSAACVTGGGSSGGSECDPSTFKPYCDGTVMVGCFDGFLVREDCATPRIDGDCAVNASGLLQCVPRADECDAATPDVCQGNDFVTCGSDRKLWRVDCTTMGFRTCGDVGGRAGCIR